MINDCMLNNHLQTLGNFLPYMISDHSPVVITFPNGDQKKKRAFRFSNFITNKEEFIETVKKEWNKEVQGRVGSENEKFKGSFKAVELEEWRCLKGWWYVERKSKLFKV